MVDGADDLVTSYARCCHHIPGDPILGHLSPGKGLVVHRDTCKNLADVRGNAEKCMPLHWSPEVHGEFPVELRLEVISDRGIIATLAARIADQDASIAQIRVHERDAHTSLVDLVISARNRLHLANIMRRIRNLKAVQSIHRVKNERSRHAQ